MTSMPEAKLAREAEISYAFVGMVTILTAWHEEVGLWTCRRSSITSHSNADKARRLVARSPGNSRRA